MDRQWSELPSDILAMIFKRLDANDIDIRCVRAVCSSWRSSASFPSKKFPHFPIQVPTFDKSHRSSTSPFAVTQGRILILSPVNRKYDSLSAPRIVHVEETAPNKWKLLHYVFVSKNLHLHKCADIPRDINLLDYKVVEIHRSYDLKCVQKAVVPLPLDLMLLQKAVAVGNQESPFTLLSLYGNGKLALWRLGEEEWTYLETRWYDSIADIVSYKGFFYAVERGGRLVKIDPETCMIDKIVAEPRLRICRDHMMLYLVAFDGRLYMVTYPEDSSDSPRTLSDVYVLNEGNGAWDSMRDWGGAVFCLGIDNAYSAMPQDVGLDEGNAVYFNCSRFAEPEMVNRVRCSQVCDLRFTNIHIYDLLLIHK